MTSPAEYNNQNFWVKFENLDIELSKEQNHQTRKELMRSFVSKNIIPHLI
jgi:hypothetical protein